MDLINTVYYFFSGEQIILDTMFQEAVKINYWSNANHRIKQLIQNTFLEVNKTHPHFTKTDVGKVVFYTTRSINGWVVRHRNNPTPLDIAIAARWSISFN